MNEKPIFQPGFTWHFLWCNFINWWWQKLLIGIVLGALYSIDDYYNGCFEQTWAQNLIGNIVGTYIIWTGSAFIGGLVEYKLDWEKSGFKKGVVLIIINVIFISVCVFGIMTVMAAVTQRPIPIKYYIIAIVSSVFVTTIINLIFISISIFNFWKNIKYENEVLKQENLRSQLETLKNQVNPHFLFNSLNTLISIIDEEPHTAKEFTQKLSQVYRYILQAREKDLVSLGEELDFSEAYEFMLKIRYGENLVFKKNIPNDYLESQIPPLVLQMLVENAIKHNVISQTKPLTVTFYTDEYGYLVVKNNLQTKIINIDSAQVGLKNIADRYMLLENKEIEIVKTDSEFIVKLPLV